MSKRIVIASIVALAVLVLASPHWLDFSGVAQEFTIMEKNNAFSKVTEGMTLEEVEGILGPGKEISREAVPQQWTGNVGKKVVEGDRFFTWENGYGVGWAFYISFRNNKVVQKFDHFPSL